MPGVTVLPSPTSGGFASSKWSKPLSVSLNGERMVISATPTRNGFTSKPSDDMSAEEIKEKAQETVKKEAKNASPLVLIRIAKSQMLKAQEYETNGDLKNALSALTKVASLTRIIMSSPEYKEEQKVRKGVVTQEFMEFFKVSYLYVMSSIVGGLSVIRAAVPETCLSGLLLWRRNSLR